MCDVESPHNPNSASMIGSLTHIHRVAFLIVSTLSVGIEFDAYSLWICGLVLSHQLSASSNNELEPSGMTIYFFVSYKLLIFNIKPCNLCWNDLVPCNKCHTFISTIYKTVCVKMVHILQDTRSLYEYAFKISFTFLRP